MINVKIRGVSSWWVFKSNSPFLGWKKLNLTHHNSAHHKSPHPTHVGRTGLYFYNQKKKKNYSIKIATANSITSVCYPFWVRYQIILFQLSWETT